MELKNPRLFSPRGIVSINSALFEICKYKRRTKLQESYYIYLFLYAALDSEKNLTGRRPAKIADLATFFRSANTFRKGLRGQQSKNFLQRSWLLIAREHLHTHFNKLRCVVDRAPQTVI